MPRPPRLENAQLKRLGTMRTSMEKRLQSAIERLLALNDNKALTIERLAAEAGVSPSRIYAYPSVKQEWDREVKAARGSKEVSLILAATAAAELHETIARLTEQRKMILDIAALLSRKLSKAEEDLVAERSRSDNLTKELIDLHKRVSKLTRIK
ncbi:hypothetical protein [Nevskia ramosa]|uniref:hypothetical protein n=1 Tax=Nevskia ramosa TaxID=64002 RepID=UPI003D0D07A2